MNARGRLSKCPTTRQNLISTLYTLAGVGLFIVAWWYAASQLPRSRLVTPPEVGKDIWTNFLISLVSVSLD